MMLLCPDVELRRTPFSIEDAVSAAEASGHPTPAGLVEILRTPPSRAEVIEHAERLGFSD